MQVNRHLDDLMADHIDHALGRPADPMRYSYRNYFEAAIGSSAAALMMGSDLWTNGRGASKGCITFSVTKKGRQYLADYLLAIGDKSRVYTVTYREGEGGISVVAESHSKAKYSAFLDYRDVYEDLDFITFCKYARVRVQPKISRDGLIGPRLEECDRPAAQSSAKGAA